MLTRSLYLRSFQKDSFSDKLIRAPQSIYKELEIETYGFTQQDLQKEFFVGNELPGDKPVRTLQEIMNLLTKSYSSNIGVQYMHCNSPEEKEWIKQKVSLSSPSPLLSSPLLSIWFLLSPIVRRY